MSAVAISSNYSPPNTSSAGSELLVGPTSTSTRCSEGIDHELTASARILFLNKNVDATLYNMNIDNVSSFGPPCTTTAATSDEESLTSSITMSSGFETALVVLLGLMMTATVIGNVLVCLSVILVRKLRHPANYLLISLAISDLCVAILVMPLALYYELSGEWTLGYAICDIWISFDVTCCTASILNLCMISVDRYLAITQPLTYCVKRTSKRMLFFIISVWITSCLISIPPLLIFGNDYGTNEEPQCAYNQNIFYQLYATLCAFYIPLIVMIILYYKIYVAAKHVVEAELKAHIPKGGKVSNESPLLDTEKVVKVCYSSSVEQTLTESTVRFDESIYTDGEKKESLMEIKVDASELLQSNGMRSPGREAIIGSHNRSDLSYKAVGETMLPLGALSSSVAKSGSVKRGLNKSRYQDDRLSFPSQSYKRRASCVLRERKASVTLGVIMTAFTACWLPFFIIALLRPFGIMSDIPRWASSFALWLGFANSTLNPVIYVTFHQDFRKAFRYLLCLQCRTMDSRLRQEAYQAQFGTSSFDRI